MRNWVEIYQSPKQRDPATIDALLSQLTQIGVLPNINNSTRFLRLATIFVIERALKQLKLEEQQQQQPQVPNGGGVGSNFSSNPAINRVAAYVELDAYARLVSILINQLGETPQSEYPNAKVSSHNFSYPYFMLVILPVKLASLRYICSNHNQVNNIFRALDKSSC